MWRTSQGPRRGALGSAAGWRGGGSATLATPANRANPPGDSNARGIARGIGLRINRIIDIINITNMLDQAALRAGILAIQSDTSLTEAEKAAKRQALLTNRKFSTNDAKKDKRKDRGEDVADVGVNGSAQKKRNGKKQKSDEKNAGAAKQQQSNNHDFDLIGDNLKCAICMNVCNKPVTVRDSRNFLFLCCSIPRPDILLPLFFISICQMVSQFVNTIFAWHAFNVGRPVAIRHALFVGLRFLGT